MKHLGIAVLAPSNFVFSQPSVLNLGENKSNYEF